MSEPADKKKRQKIDHRSREDHAVEPVHDAAVSRDQISVILDAVVPLDRGSGKIAKYGDHRADRADQGAFPDQTAFGENQCEYQNALNYNYTITDNQRPINELIQILTTQINNAEKFSYVDHQAKQHNNIPLWVLIKTITFGKVSKMYSLQQDCIKSSIAKEFPLVKENELGIMLDVLSRYRNVCAHNERLFDFKYKKSRLKTTSIHKHFNLYTNNPSASNLFDVVIFFKYLLSEYEFSKLTEDIDVILQELSRKTNQIQKSQILKLMGFPQNWKDIIDL